MSGAISSLVGVVFLWFGFLLIFFLRYKFPHFGMHFMNGISMFGVENFDFDRECKIHTKEDIELFKNKQKFILKIILITGAIIIIAYGFSLFSS